MQKTRRRMVLAAGLVALVGGVGGWLYWSAASLARWVPGRYTATALDGLSTVVVRFSPDGAAVEEIYPPGAALPKSTVSGRWRLSGRVFVLEDGPAAAAPVGPLDAFLEQFEGPLLASGLSRFRVVSADESGLVLDLGGGLTWSLSRTAGAP